MALVYQHPYLDGKGVKHYDKVKTYSDSGHQIIQTNTGRVYDEAIDVYPSSNEYAEIIPAESQETEGATDDATVN